MMMGAGMGRYGSLATIVTWLLITQGIHPSREELIELGVMDGIFS